MRPRRDPGPETGSLPGPVVGLVGHDPTDAAPRILDVTAVARNHVDVEVRDGLPCCFAEVHANVESCGSVRLLDGTTSSVDCRDQLGSLFARRPEPGRYVTTWNEECVTRGHREPVPETDDGVSVVEDSISARSAERARRIEASHPATLPCGS